MKKFKSLVLMAVLILSLTAVSCGQPVKESQSGTASEAAESAGKSVRERLKRPGPKQSFRPEIPKKQPL